jgi:dUTP pyrophosphatase
MSVTDEDAAAFAKAFETPLPRDSGLTQVQFTLLSETAKMPTYGTEGAAGLDLYADAEMTIGVRSRVLVPVGVAIAIPKGYFGAVVPRSGLALKHGVTVLNSPGIIDEDYRGQLHVMLHNAGVCAFQVHPGDRIGQLVITPYQRVKLVQVASLDDTVRGTNGFGSTGAN